MDRLDEAQFVGHGRRPREQVAHPRPGLAAALELVLGRGDRERLLGGSHARQPLPAADRFRQFLGEQVLQFRLVVEQVELRRGAGLEQVDDPLGRRVEMGLVAAPHFSPQEGSQCGRANGASEERAARVQTQGV
jgi:hypothetical protein